MKKFNKKGFTLIELLVAITILGILSTIGIGAYSSYLSSARDTKRLNDLESINSAVTQYNFEKAKYPDVSTDSIKKLLDYLDFFPVDPRHKDVTSSGATTSVLDYLYASGPGKDGVPLTGYELSTSFESKSYKEDKASKSYDYGDDDMRYEKGANIDKLITKVNNAITIDEVKCVEAKSDGTGGNKDCSSSASLKDQDVNKTIIVFGAGKFDS